MDISLVCVEDGIINIGFRKLAAYVKKELNHETSVYYAAQEPNHRSYLNMILGTFGQPNSESEDRARKMAEPVSDADIVAFSSMTPYAPLTRKLIDHVRSINPNAFIIWGGIHPIIEPEDAIQHADAICTGEGEFAFEELLHRFEHGDDITETKNFWFNRDGDITRNSHRPLMSEEEMDDLPLLLYDEGEKIFRKKADGYRPMSPDIYREYNGLGYNTLWSIGCPLHCTFCANTKFIDNHSNYTQVRHPTPSYIVDEIEQALETHPFLSSVVFHGDSTMALHPDTLREFAAEYKKRLDVPFKFMGVIPNYVTEEKMEILLDAGMHQVRMGIQNGSEEMLEFYKRPAPPEKVREAAGIINDYQKYMIPPSYDFIVDNPVETSKTVEENINLIKDLPRPFGINVYSLREIPNTKLVEQLEERDLSICSVRDSSYADCVPTIANCLIFLISTLPLPDLFYEWMLERSKPAHEESRFHPLLMVVSRFLHLARRGLNHLHFMEFSIIGNNIGYLFWKTGILSAWRKLMVPNFSIGSRPNPNATLQGTSKETEKTPAP